MESRYAALKTSSKVGVCEYSDYRNDPKFSDRQALANIVDPDHTASKDTVCHSICIFWTRYSMVEPHCSNFRIITTIFFWCPNI